MFATSFRLLADSTPASHILATTGATAVLTRDATTSESLFRDALQNQFQRGVLEGLGRPLHHIEKARVLRGTLHSVHNPVDTGIRLEPSLTLNSVKVFGTFLVIDLMLPSPPFPEPLPTPVPASSPPDLDAAPCPVSPRPEPHANPRPPSPRPEPDANPRPAAPRPEANANPWPASPRPEVNTTPRPASPRPEVNVNPQPASPRPEADANARPASPRPEPSANPSTTPPRPEPDASPRMTSPLPGSGANPRPTSPRPEPSANPSTTSSRPEPDANRRPALPRPKADATPHPGSPRAAPKANSRLPAHRPESDARPRPASPRAETDANPRLEAPRPDPDASPHLVSPLQIPGAVPLPASPRPKQEPSRTRTSVKMEDIPLPISPLPEPEAGPHSKGSLQFQEEMDYGDLEHNERTTQSKAEVLEEMAVVQYPPTPPVSASGGLIKHGPSKSVPSLPKQAPIFREPLPKANGNVVSGGPSNGAGQVLGAGPHFHKGQALGSQSSPARHQSLKGHGSNNSNVPSVKPMPLLVAYPSSSESEGEDDSRAVASSAPTVHLADGKSKMPPSSVKTQDHDTQRHAIPTMCASHSDNEDECMAVTNTRTATQPAESTHLRIENTRAAANLAEGDSRRPSAIVQIQQGGILPHNIHTPTKTSNVQSAMNSSALGGYNRNASTPSVQHRPVRVETSIPSRPQTSPVTPVRVHDRPQFVADSTGRNFGMLFKANVPSSLQKPVPCHSGLVGRKEKKKRRKRDNWDERENGILVEITEQRPWLKRSEMISLLTLRLQPRRSRSQCQGHLRYVLKSVPDTTLGRRFKKRWSQYENGMFYNMEKLQNILSDDELIERLVCKLGPRRSFADCRRHLMDRRNARALTQEKENEDRKREAQMA